MNTIQSSPRVTAYVGWASATMTGARVTMAGTSFQDDSEINMSNSSVVDVQRRTSGDVDLLIVCHGNDDPAAKEQEISEELIAAASPPFDAARWLTGLAQQGGWWTAMADGRVGLGFSRCHFTEEQMAEARRMIAALSDGERDAVEDLVRERAGVEVIA